MAQVHDNVKEYYGERVKTSEDLMTSCCTVDRDTFSSDAKDAMKLVHPQVLSNVRLTRMYVPRPLFVTFLYCEVIHLERNYGCGAVYPEAVEGCKVLDLGSGAGLDCFVLSKLVGPTGYVTGVDMTKEQLAVAREHIDYHTTAFGYTKPNVEFCEGFIEQLEVAGLKDETFDVIVSNCVVNLSPNKEAVLREAFRVLKNGGEMYFSDIYSNQHVPESLRKNQVLWGECISGALQWKELMKMATDIGFAPPILVTSTLYRCDDPSLEKLLNSSGCSGLQFCSATYRLLKVPWEKSGVKESLTQVQYKGTISGYSAKLKFSCQASLKTNCSVTMWSSVSSVLKDCPRLSPHFTVTPQDGGDTTPLTPPLSEFVDINPFEKSSKSIPLAPPKFASSDDTASCCSSGSSKECDVKSPQQQPCCGSGNC